MSDAQALQAIYRLEGVPGVWDELVRRLNAHGFAHEAAELTPEIERALGVRAASFGLRGTAELEDMHRTLRGVYRAARVRADQYDHGFPEDVRAACRRAAAVGLAYADLHELWDAFWREVRGGRSWTEGQFNDGGR